MKELALNPIVMELASAVVHADELIDAIESGKPPEVFDIKAFKGNLANVQDLLGYMENLALIPLRRDSVRYSVNQ